MSTTTVTWKIVCHWLLAPPLPLQCGLKYSPCSTEWIDVYYMFIRYSFSYIYKINMKYLSTTIYRIVGMFDEGESLTNLANHQQFTKLKSSKLVVTINNLLVDLVIRQSYFHQILQPSTFTKHYRCLYI